MCRIAGSAAATAFVIATTSLPPGEMTSAPRFASPPSRSSCAPYAAARCVLAAQVRDRGRERKQLRQVNRVRARRGRLDAALHPPARLVRPPALPGGLRRSESGGHRALEPLLLLEDPDGQLRLADRAVEAARHLGGLREEEPRLALQRPVPAPPLVLEELQRRLRGARRLLGTEGFQGLLRELQAVFDRLLRHVSLGEMVDELRVDELEAVRRSASRGSRHSADAGNGGSAATGRCRGRRARCRSKTPCGRRASPAPPRGFRRGGAGPRRRRDPSRPRPAPRDRGRRSSGRGPRPSRERHAPRRRGVRSASRPPAESWRAGRPRRARPRRTGSAPRCRPARSRRSPGATARAPS